MKKVQNILSLAVTVCAFFLLTNCAKEKSQTTKINVNTSEVVYQMKGGMGASWHAISKEMPLDNHLYKYPVRETGPRGSAYGGNPPVTDTAAWNQVFNHASWLGLNFVRVELSQRMYEPKRQQFDWENDEMKALFNILDWCQKNGADVFLQQMWHYNDWNAFPGIHPLLSAPKDLDAYTQGIATLIEYLTGVKGYTCIKYFCMTNEPPGGTWGYWWEYGENEGEIEDAWALLKQEFDNRGITIPISGPDWTDMPPFEEEKLGFTKHFGAIDIHSYQGISPEGEENLRKWANWVHQQGKPFFLTEYGNMKLGWGKDDPNQKSFEAALSNASDVMRGMRARVDAFNRWSFVNRGDLDGQWQLIHTYDRKKKEHLKEVLPEPEAYYGFGIISRFLSKYSSVLKTEVNAPDSVLMSNAVKSPGGILSVFLVNKSDKELNVEINISGNKTTEMHLYQVSKEIINMPGFEFNSSKSFAGSGKCAFVLPPKSISTLTQTKLNSTDKGVVL